jgi:hypothetical protein
MMLQFKMLKQTTAPTTPPEKEFWSVSDEHAAGAGDVGRQLEMFPTKIRAQVFESRLKEVVRYVNVV